MTEWSMTAPRVEAFGRAHFGPVLDGSDPVVDRSGDLVTLTYPYGRFSIVVECDLGVDFLETYVADPVLRRRIPLSAHHRGETWRAADADEAFAEQANDLGSRLAASGTIDDLGEELFP